MGRRNTSAATPQRQRSCLPANRELRMAIKGHTPKSFGVRRRLLEEYQAPLREIFSDMQEDNIFPTELEARENLQVTLLPRRRLDRQLRRGLVLGYEFGRAVAATRQEIHESAQNEMFVKLGRATVIKSRFVALTVESEALEKEYSTTCEVLGRFGVKGMMRDDQPPLHITLGESADFIAKKRQSEIEVVLNDVMPIGDYVALHDIAIYPDENAIDR